MAVVGSHRATRSSATVPWIENTGSFVAAARHRWSRDYLGGIWPHADDLRGLAVQIGDSRHERRAMTTHRLLGLIAQQLLKSVSKLRKQKVVDFAAFSAGKRHAEALQANVVSTKRLAELHPLHARYVAVQNQVSVMSEQLIMLPELARLSKVLTDGGDVPAIRSTHESADIVVFLLLVDFRRGRGDSQGDIGHMPYRLIETPRE